MTVMHTLTMREKEREIGIIQEYLTLVKLRLVLFQHVTLSNVKQKQQPKANYRKTLMNGIRITSFQTLAWIMISLPHINTYMMLKLTVKETRLDVDNHGTLLHKLLQFQLVIPLNAKLKQQLRANYRKTQMNGTRTTSFLILEWITISLPPTNTYMMLKLIAKAIKLDADNHGTLLLKLIQFQHATL